MRVLGKLLLGMGMLWTATPLWGTTYYVGKSGSDGNSCATAQSSTAANRKLTIGSGIGCLSAGDTLIVGNGTYAERVNNTLPAGSSSSALTTLQAETEPTIGSKGEITAAAIIRPSSGTDVVVVKNNYVKIHGFDIDATSADGAPIDGYNGGVTFTGAVIEYNRLHGGNNNVSSMSGLLGDFTAATIQYNEVDHNGDVVGGNQDHGIYTPGPSNTIQYNYAHDNEGYCLVIYPSANSNTIRGNRCESNDNRGIIISGDSNLFYNNIEDSDAWGIEVQGSSNKLYNNTLYNNGHGAAGTGQQCVVVTSGASNEGKNNICYQNEVNSIVESGGTITTATNLTSNPSFGNESGHDFTLISGSAAINVGTDLSGTFTIDIIGVTRPQQGVFDEGAYEFVSGVSTAPLVSYNFNEGSGTVVLDITGNSNTLALTGSYTWTTGHSSGGVQFDGSTAYGQATTFANLSNWTVELWVRSGAAPGSGGISAPLHREKNFQINWDHTDASCRGAAGVSVAGTFYCASFGTLASNTWYHLAATYDGTSLRAYTNGVLNATTAASPAGSADSESLFMTVGRHANLAAARYFSGIVDDIRIYNRVLTSTEITTDMNSPVGTEASPAGAAYNIFIPSRIR